MSINASTGLYKLFALVATLGLLVSGDRVVAAEKAIDESPLPVGIEIAFPRLTFSRPILLTHAGDGSDRVFVPSQLGQIYVFPNKQDAGESDVKIFLDLWMKVEYKDRENEEGLLGLAFHPKYKENGEFFVYYTTKEAPHTSVISRFRVSKDDPDVADPKSEEELLRIPQPFWNHNGGTIIFGPDGYLYIALGDGGSANDPLGHGQNLGTLFGTVLRIDVDNKDPDLNYAIPKDNPFVDREGARGEIWAYGLRNIWRMAFDPETKLLWAGDVGQDLWEEIDIIKRGGNYGWNIREATHNFKAGQKQPADTPSDPPISGLIDPIFEYHHDIGRSITGGCVYRGTRVPELVGKYIYADYITGRIWALEVDGDEDPTVVGNHPINGNQFPIMSFGEDQHRDVYFMIDGGSTNPTQLRRFVSAEKK